MAFCTNYRRCDCARLKRIFPSLRLTTQRTSRQSAAFRNCCRTLRLLPSLKHGSIRQFPIMLTSSVCHARGSTIIRSDATGFHGASHSYVSERVPQLLEGPENPPLRLISCHLGGSSSLCAIRGGKSIDTTLGSSTQYGVLQSTRSGDLDPFAVLYVMDQEGQTTNEIRRQLVQESGLLGFLGGKRRFA